MIRRIFRVLLMPLCALAGFSATGQTLTDFVAGRSQDGSVLIGLTFIDEQCTGFAYDESDWVIAVDEDTLVVRYGDMSAANELGINCAFPPLSIYDWPTLSVALSARDYMAEVPDAVQHVRLEVTRRVCSPEVSEYCVTTITRLVLGEAELTSLPRTAARLEAGVWRPDAGAGVIGRPGASLQVREDGSALSLVWIGADAAGAADWVAIGGQLSDAAATLPAYSSRAGLCAFCRPPELHLVALDASVTVWIRSATEIWLGGLPVRGRSLPMQPWQPWSMRSEQMLQWPLEDPVSGIAIATGRSEFADLQGEWLDVHRAIASSDGRLRFEQLSRDSQQIVYAVEWTAGQGQARCGPAGECVIEGPGSDQVSFRLSGIGADRVYSTQAPCLSRATCDDSLGGLLLLRLD
ncbi:MAG: hypothetical protein KDI51_16495 [Xanthomonadales bacterium]|nr:hypothetical protein [Xanthomonadales bacterium]